MAGLLKMLSAQPTPLLQRLSLDKQPARPLIQRLFPGRKPRPEPRAYASAPLGFLSMQPARPLLAGLSLWTHPLIGRNTWLSRPPMAAMSKPGKPVLAKMDGTRTPGIVTALLLLGLSIAYLVTQVGITPDIADTEVAADTAPEAPAVDVVVEADLPPSKEANEPDVTPAEEDKPVSVKEEMMVAAPAAKAETRPQTQAAEPAGKDSAQFSLAPLTPEEEAEIEAAIAQARGDKPAASEKEAIAKAKAANLMADPKAAKLPAEAESAAKRETATAPTTEKSPAAEPKSEKSATAVASAQPAKPATSQAKAPGSKPAARQGPAEPAPSGPPTLSAERSQAILDSARYIYQLGDGPMALERIGLALSAGHVHPDYVSKLNALDGDIRRLLGLFDQAVTTTDPNQAALKRAAFLDAEQRVIGNETSAYAARLEMAANMEIQGQ